MLHKWFLNRKLFILDVKNWRGTIKSDIDGSWCQTFENGLFVRHGNIVSLLLHTLVLAFAAKMLQRSMFFAKV